MSEELRKMLKRHEGVKNFVYLCSEGYETIGVGRNIADSGLGLSDDEVDYLLDNDIKRVKDELNDEYYCHVRRRGSARGTRYSTKVFSITISLSYTN